MPPYVQSILDSNKINARFFLPFRYQADYYGWTQTFTITSGSYANSDWCFCHYQPYSDEHFFKVTYNKFKTDLSDELKWFSSYKKMPSKLKKSTSGRLEMGESFNIYSMVVQAQWISTSIQLLFEGVNVTIEAF